MALAAPTYADSGLANTASSVVTKPVGLAVGDLMVAQVVTEAGVTITAPSGFTSIRNDTNVFKSTLYSKIADSGDVAATNFTFSFSPSSVNSAGIVRVTGNAGVLALTAQASASVTNSASPSFANTVTPKADSLLLFFTSSNSQHTTAGYAVATDNPTWTEMWDATGGVAVSMAAAYAVRSQTTATGNSSATGGVATDDWVGQILSIAPPIVITVNETITLVETRRLNQVKTISDILTVTDSIETSSETQWSNTNKNSSSWVNLQK